MPPLPTSSTALPRPARRVRPGRVAGLLAVAAGGGLLAAAVLPPGDAGPGFAADRLAADRLAADRLAAGVRLASARTQESIPPPGSADEEPEAAAAEGPREVIVRVDDRTDVGGTLELETDEVVVLLTPQGRVRSFARTAIRQVFHLLGEDPGRRGVLYLRDGTVHEGRIVRDVLDEVVLELGGIEIAFPRDRVDRLEPEPTVREEYEHRVALLDRDDVHAHFALCRWLVREQAWELADFELGRLLGRMEFGPARRLQRLVDAQLELARARAEAAAEADADAATGDGKEPAIPGPLRLLYEREVDLVRVYEIDFARPPRVDVPRAIVTTLLDRYAGSGALPEDPVARDRLHRLPSIEIVRLMFELRARELYGEIRVRTEPHALDLFRRRVHDAWLIRRCGTCHHAAHPGPFRLVVERSRRPEVRTTNLLLLERTPVAGGTLVDYDDPASSLILQHAMPRERARLPHPDVEGFEPVFTGPDDERLAAAIRWIESMFRPRPDYPVELGPEDVFGPREPAATDPGPPAEGQEPPEDPSGSPAAR